MAHINIDETFTWMKIVWQILMKKNVLHLGLSSVGQYDLTKVPSGVIDENYLETVGDHCPVVEG